MNSKSLSILMIFGLLVALAQCRRYTLRSDEVNDDDSSAGGGDDSSSEASDAELRGTESMDLYLYTIFFDIVFFFYLLEFVDEKRAILRFLENNDDASQFLDHSRRLFSSKKGRMEEARER